MKHTSFSLVIGILLCLGLIQTSFASGTYDDPHLPLGIGSEGSESEPELPFTFELEDKTELKGKDVKVFSSFFADLGGFLDARMGVRTQNDPYQKYISLGEARFQIDVQNIIDKFLLNVTIDFVYDPVVDRHSVKLETGQGFIDLREVNIIYAPLEFTDVKLGRQILTWGTGDLLFINDLFPKDWKSFFIGRDVEYLKAPSDALKLSIFTTLVNIDIVYTPQFDSDRFIDGSRISYWNSSLGQLAGRNNRIDVNKPDNWFEDDEWAIRLSKNLRGYELAAYGYRGFWKSPAGQEPILGQAIFPDLSVYGMSIRGQFLRGIANFECGYYLSQDDQNGDNPLIKNNEMRNLIGYEQEIASDFTMGIQYYLEYMMDYHAYLNSLPGGVQEADKDRHLITLRLTRLFMNQNLKISLFTFYSPSDNDSYIRPLIHYKIDDHWSVEAGGNLFFGENAFTFFGQFKKNSNVYTGLRYGF